MNIVHASGDSEEAAIVPTTTTQEHTDDGNDRENLCSYKVSSNDLLHVNIVSTGSEQV